MLKQLTAFLLIIFIQLPTQGEDHLPETFFFDFRNKQFDNVTLVPLKAGAVRLIRPTSKGVWVKKPAKTNIPVVGFGTRFRIRGDFEISASFTVPSWVRPKKGYGQGPSIYIRINDESEISALIGRLLRPKDGHIYSTSLSKTVDDIRKYNVKLYDTKFDSGALQLTRNNNTLSFFIKEGQEFIKLREVEFGDGDVDLLRIGLQQSDAETPVEVIWESLSVKAESLLGLPSKLAKGENYTNLVTT